MSDADPSIQLDRYQRLLELSRDVASTLDLSKLLDRIVDAAADLCGAQAASILLYDSAKDELYFEAATNLETPLMRGLVVPVDSSIAGWILKSRQPLIISEAQTDPRHFGEIGQTTQVQTDSLLGVPLISREKVIGVLEAINKHQGDFNEKDQELLVALAAQATIAIENARLFQQSDNISELVHELRTPLSSLTTIAHLLKRPNLAEPQRIQLAQTMQNELNRLSEMASVFLDLARLESGRTPYKIESLELAPIIQDCANVMSSKIDERKQTLRLDLPTNLPPVSGDQDKLKQVFLNLLSNAAKYTPEGGHITLSALSENGEVQVKVSDTGIGIPAKDLPCIFEKFYRVPQAAVQAPGTGLGLSICRRIIEAHKGRIQVESQEGKGSTFRINLPVLKVVAAA
jgi:signal transduction histidine kinase